MAEQEALAEGAEGQRTLLIDGDIIAFLAAAGCQKVREDAFGYIEPFASVVEGMATVDNMLLGLMDGLSATHMKVVLSDPLANWRSKIAPSYKENRQPKLHSRPLLLARLKEYLRASYNAEHWPALEADDVLGILATEPQDYPGDRIVVGRDKDFKSIPGLHHAWKDRGADGKLRILEIDKLSADQWHMIQTLAGDDVDGYGGCPNIGTVRAMRIVEAPVVLRPERGVITRGKNKGKETTKWVAHATTDVWACVVSHFVSEGLTEEDALRNARLARILRHGEYDRESGRITLWTPHAH